MKATRKYGLIGKDIAYSFSKSYFQKKFENQNQYNFTYENFDIQEVNDFVTIIKENPELKGINVTIPYKQTIIPFLHELSTKASKIGAVNVVRFTKEGKLKGYNSDCYGFKKALKPLLKPDHKKALILGTGGAAKAISFALTELAIDYLFVSTKISGAAMQYNDINESTFSEYQIVVNCTPVGTFPNVNLFPELPYHYFSKNHIAFDLIYNPDATLFLKMAGQYGAVCKNGSEMLVFQAEKAWEIWNK